MHSRTQKITVRKEKSQADFCESQEYLQKSIRLCQTNIINTHSRQDKTNFISQKDHKATYIAIKEYSTL